MINSPNKVFAQANHLRENFDASSLWKVSCIKPVLSCVSINCLIHHTISLSYTLVIARNMIPIGQMVFSPACGPPCPSPASPLK